MAGAQRSEYRDRWSFRRAVACAAQRRRRRAYRMCDAADADLRRRSAAGRGRALRQCADRRYSKCRPARGRDAARFRHWSASFRHDAQLDCGSVAAASRIRRRDCKSDGSIAVSGVRCRNPVCVFRRHQSRSAAARACRSIFPGITRSSLCRAAGLGRGPRPDVARRAALRFIPASGRRRAARNA